MSGRVFIGCREHVRWRLDASERKRRTSMGAAPSQWREHGVRLVRADQLDFTVPQRPGTTRAVAIDQSTGGANKLWAGRVTMPPHGKTDPHHHGDVEVVIYMVSGRLRLRWG